MAIEVEYKFKLTEAVYNTLLTLADFSVESGEQKIVTTYYDSPEGCLRKAGYALRIRELENGFVQSLKGKGTATGALHQREEWETHITDNHIYPEYLPVQHLRDQVAQLQKHQQLLPIFITDFVRQRWEIDFQGAKIELAIDRGVTRINERCVQIFELELELLAGPLEGLTTFVTQLQQKVPLVAEHQSKAERAYLG